MARSFVIDDEIKALLPLPTDDERRRLRALIETDGHVDTLVILVIGKTRILGDGHTRLEICEELGIVPPEREIKIGNRDLAIQWVIDNQLGRRNLTDERRAYFLGKKYLLAKSLVPHSEDRKDNSGRLSAEIGNASNVSHATVERAGAFAAAVDSVRQIEGPEAAEEILSGQSDQTRAEVVASVVLCGRCQRTGPVKDCQACVEARKIAGKKPLAERPQSSPRRAPSTNGRPVFDWKTFDIPFGQLMRALDSLGHAYHCKEGAELAEARDHLGEVLKISTAIKRKAGT